MGRNRYWTAQEIDYLTESWGKYSIKTIAKKLNRTTNAVMIKAQKLSLGSFLMSGDYITLNQLMNAIVGKNETSYHLISYVKKRGLPIHYKTVNNNRFLVVYLDEFWEFAEKNRSFIDFSRIEPMSLGKEPEWVAEQRRNDYASLPIRRKDRWTQEEDNRLIDLLKTQKFGYAEISEKLGRSEGAIQRRCTDLGIKYRPVKANTHGSNAVWTEHHYRVLADGIRNGESYRLIGQKIGKSEKAVRGKVYSVYFTENADKVRSMLQNGEWGNGAPSPTVKQAVFSSRHSASCKKELSTLAGLLKYRINKLGYDPYWQRFMCENWDDFNGCSAGCTCCDSCVEFKRIRPQYCKRCGKTFYERKSNDFCNDCRIARKKQAYKKQCILNKKGVR